MPGILISLAIGAVCGWLASILMGGKKGGLLLYIILGLLGGVVGSWIGTFVKIGGLLGQIVLGVAGTCVLIFAYRLIFGKKR